MAVTLFTFLALPAAAAEPVPPAQLPRLIDSGTFPTGHIQGIAVDTEHRYIYYSYTTMLVKADMQGRVVGTVTGLMGHLGSLTFNAEDGRVYGSLEYKNDAIGRGILAASGHDGEINDGFYIAIFDVARITRTDMSAERDGVMTAVFIGDILRDYTATVRTEQGERQHRFGCSGFDGITFGPRFGRTGGHRYLTLSYGIYDDTTRTDNDYQVLTMMVAAGGQDLFFGTGEVFLDYAEEGALIDLRTVLSEETLAKYEDCLVYSTENGETEPYPCAVWLSDNEWIQKYNYYDTCYFGIFDQSEKQDVSGEFAEFLLNY